MEIKAVTNANYIPLDEAAALVPGGISYHSLWRWCRLGILTKSGKRIRLGHCRVGRKLVTTEGDLEAFFKLAAETDLEEFAKRDDVPRAPRTKPLDDRIRSAERLALAQGIL